MPYSDSSFDIDIQKFITLNPFKRYLDVGPGAGKYGNFILAHVQGAVIEAVEAEKKYVKDFELEAKYNHIYSMPIQQFIDRYLDYTTDVVIIGDCIEHLKKSEGIDVLHFFLYRARYIVVVFPEKYLQYTWQGHISEAHRSAWFEEDFHGMDYEMTKKDFMRLVIIKGYIGDPNAITGKKVEE